MTPAERLKQMEKEYLLLESISAALAWDQETGMPEGALGYRSEQLSYLQQQSYRVFTESSIGEAITNYQPEDLEDKAWKREIKKVYSRMSKFPEKHVTTKSRTVSMAQAAWAKARETNDFSLFSPYLQKIVDLNKAEADYIGWGEHPYDALVDQFEPGMTTKQLESVFSPLEDFLSKLVKKIAQAPQVDDSFLSSYFPEPEQKALGLKLLGDMGYDMNRGRLDETQHPFTTNLGSDDVRVTTHYYTDNLLSSMFSVIHEGGHGLYEQGVADRFKGTFLGQINSLGLHESQSRFWENIIGRSLEASHYYLPTLQNLFPKALGTCTADQFYRGMNKVEPSFIRVEADEVTYNLHIILRFNMELQLITGNLKVEDVPEMWNAEMKRLLGIVPANNAEGCLQDIHWSMGTFGYFPTYTLGNLYSAQFYNSMKKDLPHLSDNVKKGDFSSILQWLRTNIHQQGSLYNSGELCEKVTGQKLDSQFYKDYIMEKYGRIYSL